jgi:hypothetical protein
LSFFFCLAFLTATANTLGGLIRALVVAIVLFVSDGSGAESPEISHDGALRGRHRSLRTALGGVAREGPVRDARMVFRCAPVFIVAAVGASGGAML